MNPRRDYVEVVCPEFKRPRPVAKVTAMARKFTGVCVECHNKSIREAAMARLEEIRRAKMVSSFVPKTSVGASNATSRSRARALKTGCARRVRVKTDKKAKICIQLPIQVRGGEEMKCKCGNNRFRGRKIRNLCQAGARTSCIARCTKCGRNVTIDAEALYLEGKLQLVRATLMSRPAAFHQRRVGHGS